MTEDHEVYFEAGHIDEDGENNETRYACCPMFRLVSLRQKPLVTRKKNCMIL
jgi:hypothetical protein